MKSSCLGCALALVAAACSASSSNTEFGAGSGGAGTESAGNGTGGAILTSSGAGAGSSTGSSMGCSAAAQLVYVLSTDNDLYSFQPDKKVFTKIGPIQCQTSMQPNSMAINRNAVAWVNYVQGDAAGHDTAGAVFKVSTSDASCQSSSIPLPPNWYRLGMGFSSDFSGSSKEQLFVNGTTGQVGAKTSPGLGRIDSMSQQLTPVGPFPAPLTGESCELTGTGDARLFGFFTSTPVHVAEIDKTSAGILSNNALPNVEVPWAWAFSFWGGSFYLYTSPDPMANPTRTTNVTKYDPTTGTADTAYMTNIGFKIVGAGVSTCAPVTPPN